MTDGSVLVEGLLEMRPSSGDVTHKLVFENVDEAGSQAKADIRSVDAFDSR